MAMGKNKIGSTKKAKLTLIVFQIPWMITKKKLVSKINIADGM